MSCSDSSLVLDSINLCVGQTRCGVVFFFSSRRRHTRSLCDWSSDVCSSDLGWSLKAFKCYYIPWKDIGLAGIVVEPTDDLLRLQQKLIDAVAPFTAETGTAAAFVTTPKDPDINKPTIDYVATFVPKASGKDFNPHVTVGIASQDYLKKMLAEPFDVFTLSPAGASVYQLGNFGTARKKLKAWEFKS